jgi:hypothetical protein
MQAPAQTVASSPALSAPRVQEAVEQARLRGPGAPPARVGAGPFGTGASADAEAPPGETEDERLGVTPTPDEAIRLSDRIP